MRLLKSIIKCVVVIVIILFSANVFAQSANNIGFNKMLDQYYDEGIIFNPLAATQRGDNRFNDLLPNNISAPYLKKSQAYILKYQQLLKTFSRASLNAFDKVSFDIVSLQIKQAQESEKFHLEYLPFNQMNGLPNQLPSLGSGLGIQPFKTVKDYQNWLK